MAMSVPLRANRQPGARFVFSSALDHEFWRRISAYKAYEYLFYQKIVEHIVTRPRLGPRRDVLARMAASEGLDHGSTLVIFPNFGLTGLQRAAT